MLNIQQSETAEMNSLQQQNEALIKRVEELTDTLSALLEESPSTNNQSTPKSHSFFNS